MEKFEEKEIGSRRVFDGRLLGVRVDTVKLPSGVESTREIVEHPGAVAVIALTADHELVLVRQFRKATGEVLLEVPAGVPRKGERGEDTARRELEEETGYHAKKITKFWEGYASPGYSNELIQYYLAQDMNLMKSRRKVGIPTSPIYRGTSGQKTEADEYIEVDLVEVDLCLDLIRTGKIKDNKTIVGVMIADLFLRGEI